MGLFDNYFDPSTYDNSGGLVGRLQALLQTQNQYQPGDAQAAMPQNAPIAVGNYMMPRIGAGFSPPQIDSQTGETVQPGQSVLPAQTSQEQAAGQLPAQFQQSALPPNAQPTQGQLPTALQPQASGQLPPQLQPQGQSFGDRLMTGLHNATHGGGLITGLIDGLVTGQRTDPQGIAQQKLQAQYQALVPVLGAQKAMIATINPEAGKILIAQALGPQTLTSLGQGYVADKNGNVRRAYEPDDVNQVVQIGESPMGGKQYGVFNKGDGTIKPYTAPGASAQGGLGDINLTGKDYLASIPAPQRGTVQGMIEGTIPPPTSFAMTKPYWQNMIAAAKNADPTFDSANWSGRVAGVRDFSAGKSSEMVRSANQTIGHVGDLIQKMDALNNGNYPTLNSVENYVSSATGGAAVTGFQQTAHAVADELSKVFKGQGISDTEIRQWEQNLSPNMSPAQQHEAVMTAMSLLQHSLSALEEKRLNSIGPVAAEKAGPLLKPDAQAAIDRIQKWATGKAGEAAAAPATTKTGVSWSVVQ